MKKYLLMMTLALLGGVTQVKADEYSIQFNQDGNWYKLCDLTDDDGDGVYSAIVNMETAEKIGWGTCTIQLCTGTSLAAGWGNAIWANQDSDTSVFSEESFTLSDSWAKDGKLNIPIKDVVPNTYAVKFEYTPGTHIFSAVRLVEFASSNDDWHTSNPVYLQETAHHSNIFQKTMALPAGTNYKFVVNGNSNDKSGQVVWYGYTSGTFISESGDNMTISNDGIYIITANLSNYHYVAPELVTVPASVGTYGMATLCSEYDLDFTGVTAVTAYKITANDKATGTLTKEPLTGKVPANTGIYLEGEAGASANIPTTLNASAVAGNMLVGVTENTNIAQISGDYTNYILTVNKAGGDVATPKFFKVNTAGNTVKANKAYLQIPTASASRDYFWFNDFTTAIDAVKQEQKMEGEVYNLAGQRIAQPTKGLYIVNGKKVIIK